MAKAKLKAALANQQYNAARAAAKKRAAAAEEAKKASVKAGLSGIKKGAKRAKAATAANKGRNAVSASGSSSGSGPHSAAVGENGGGPSKSAAEEHSPDEYVAGISASNKGKAKIQGTNPFDRADTILLLGEGNFSFSHSLLLPPHNIPPYQILATAYDSQDVTYKKYPDAQRFVETLRERGARVEFGVDAGALEKCKAVGKGRKWSKVVFNFPHVGAGITDQDRNILSNQTMLLRFFRSVEPLLTDGPSAFPSQSQGKSGAALSNTKKLKGKGKGKGNAKELRRVNKDSGTEDEEDEDADGLEDEDSPYILNEGGDGSATAAAWGVPDSLLHRQEFTPPKRQGSILLTLLSCPPYTLWTVPKLATKPPHLCPGTHLPQPKYDLARSFEFVPALYEGYEHRRTIGWKDGKSKGANEEILGRKGKARTWEFVRAEPGAESD
ncbi:hypothetical protein I317_02439 [Kwoniella heveanensis CBS 569]|uniref:25S rRNA (uridine-N(3))-methyltransferase BMT5-like domain-containing protein n=1 Tax=Kwoniella heveanensis BCC8398 TaxID=1296120 RepID=A0A1B9GT30_9TREE|nr:hypothetical protein I316_04180 [Kwoniella heveanensis BCC8398]OCF43688.1 hypothetical protein I317_02439 [Kwoniella heveanensis CBS 569]